MTARRFDADDADGGVHFLQVATDAADCAARTDTGIEAVDLATSLAPDLGARTPVMRLDVELVLVLVRTNVFAAEGLALDHALDDTARAFGRKQRAKFVFYLDQLGAKEPQQRLLLFGSALGNRNLDRCVACVGHCRQCDTGIAGRRFDERLVLTEL